MAYVTGAFVNPRGPPCRTFFFSASYTSQLRERSSIHFVSAFSVGADHNAGLFWPGREVRFKQLVRHAERRSLCKKFHVFAYAQ